VECGWPEEEFFELMATAIEDHYRRYIAEIHLTTSADGARSAYKRWPHADRPEEATAAISFDRWLECAWGYPPTTSRPIMRNEIDRSSLAKRGR
jgi:hypothetical protein